MSDLLVSLPSDPGLRDAVGDVDGVEFVEWDLDAPAPRERLDIVVPPYWGGARPLAQLAGVDARLVQWQSIGYNGVTKHLPEGLPLANAATVHEGSTAELAMGLALAAQRGIPQFVRDAEEERWQLRSLPSLADRRVLLVGYGGVSQAIEARLAGFEVEITRLARTARREENLAGQTVEVRGFESLHESLAEAEIVMLAVPLTDGTRGLIDGAALAAMPDGALLVNVARGPVVDTDALVAELQSGRLRAALDVTDPEPLPAGHPLWAAPNVLITPHVGGDSSAMLPRMSALIRRQIAHLQRGEVPENLVLGDWEKRPGSPTL
ncbi:2-hydroxyacid dehydrogenase [Leucobacter chromiiresistens]|uniref:Hydroxyacid dehydrogenase n=1 Tax=Leucobacter chromiiresistens TaxID=1079994 RepID=A0A147EP92_9MICO|nr:2-hydroxyacid dehydrogenase [Leucobacter chromiiresistens]KTR86365.1 hydroxyacid dehydrogenase [Leucobacter chromiiresistens]